jgi:Helix-turn-helix domain
MTDDMGTAEWLRGQTPEFGTGDLPPFAWVPSIAFGDRTLLESDLRVLGVLCARYNRQTRQCNPSHRSIAADCGFSVTTVKHALRRLRHGGYVDWLGTVAWTGGQGTNMYSIPLYDTAQGLSVTIPDEPSK